MTPSEDLRAAIGFLTPLPLPSAQPTNRAMRAFPVVGAGIGLVSGIAWRLARSRCNAGIAGIIGTALDVAITSGMHLDGLADASDGLLAHVPAKSRLDIMAEPDIGTYGAIGVAMALGSRAVALAICEPSVLLLTGLSCASRSIMALVPSYMSYARPGGLAQSFLEEHQAISSSEEQASVGAAPPRRPSASGSPLDTRVGAMVGIVGAFALVSLGAKRRGVLALASGMAASAGVLCLAKRRIGGFTGDVLGAAGVVCEVVGLVVASGRS